MLSERDTGGWTLLFIIRASPKHSADAFHEKKRRIPYRWATAGSAVSGVRLPIGSDPCPVVDVPLSKTLTQWISTFFQ